MILGAQYYRPPNPPRADWKRDLERIRASGFTTVKYWACWSWMGTDPAFADLDELMDLAAANDLGVVINTILENAPYALAHGHPEARYHDHEGRPVALTAAMNTPGGGWPGLCFDNDAVRDASAAFLTALVGRYRDHPALRVWDVWNEPHLEPASYFPERMYCYCDASRERFRGWLHKRYGTLGALNAAWARRFTDWAQVEPPRVFEAVPDLLDWRGFWFDTLAAWLEHRCAVVRAADPTHAVMTHVALSGFTGQLATHTLDEYTLTGPVDLFGTSSFPTWLMDDDHVEHLFNLDTARDAADGKPFWQAELQGGRGRRHGRNSTRHPDPATLALWIWNSLAAGATGVMFWQWRPELLGPESPGYGLCTPDGDPTDRLRAASDLAPIATDPALAGRIPDPPTTALLVSRRSALHAFATDRTMDLYRDAVLGAYRMLIDADVAPAVLPDDRAENGIPDHVTHVYWPMPTVASERLAAALTAFVGRGGTLVAEAAPGEYTPLGARRAVVPGAGLDALFGVRQLEADAAAEGWQREALRLDDAEVLHRFDDGSPSVTRVRRGAGTATVIATYPSLGGTGIDVVGLLAPGRGAVRWDRPAPGLVSRGAGLVDGRRVVFLVNWTQVEQHGEDSRGTRFRIPARSGRLLIHD